MSAVDRIMHEYRVSKRRFDAVISAVEVLSTEQRKELVAVLLEGLEGAAKGTGPVEPVQRRRPARVPPNGAPPRARKTDRAEAVVRERPGLTSQEIGVIIQQARPAADSTLRQVETRRGTIERRDGRWYPVTPPNGGGPPPSAN